ncbi:DUF2243 domain-containing protein [Natronococcus wangiae]|uniref:DUF2243 domain-containing protein n=1 Tax=Natronococcus wangiae TaxID=3068275 RepID=UPI00273D88C3|nr:DUF2243 domain-containing protein [Natronococcus sp. AD5]
MLHQLLQWHHMLSARTDPTVVSDLQRNVLADELFHQPLYGRRLRRRSSRREGCARASRRAHDGRTDLLNRDVRGRGTPRLGFGISSRMRPLAR